MSFTRHRKKSATSLIMTILIGLSSMTSLWAATEFRNNSSIPKKSGDVDSPRDRSIIKAESNTNNKQMNSDLSLAKRVTGLENAFQEIAALKENVIKPDDLDMINVLWEARKKHLNQEKNWKQEMQKEIEALKAVKEMGEDDVEKIQILWAARERQKSQDKNWKEELEKEMESLKEQNRNQIARINQLEEKLRMPHKQQIKELPNNNNGGLLKMPTNCKDLSDIGHTLSGFHLIKDGKLENENKIVAVYCNFQSQKDIIEKNIGFVDIKTFPNGVHFYVQRKAPFYGKANAVIPFDLALVNEGKAMDIKSGIFTAPVPGVYHFSFKGVKDINSYSQPMEIHLRHNKKVIGTAFASQKLSPPEFANLDVHATLKLKTGDQVDLCKLDDRGILFDNWSPDTHFTGMLLEEELESLLKIDEDLKNGFKAGNNAIKTPNFDLLF